VLLGGYAFGVVVLSGLALWDLLRAGAAGVYLLLVQPYGIGDRVEVDGHRGIVQDVDVFITRVEADGEEFIVPNHRVFRSGVVRIRE
jgi:small-conductance mechanosensitive channel